ncbi:hypothetical protein KAR28_05205 [Candidatus Parcubacteria bacterium]|nr:hypothetical protein [Candidatus Parcubacteria bacterium]
MSSFTRIAVALKRHDPVPVDFKSLVDSKSLSHKDHKGANVKYEVEAENNFEAAVTAGVIQKACVEPAGKIGDDIYFKINDLCIEEQATKQAQKG